MLKDFANLGLEVLTLGHGDEFKEGAKGVGDWFGVTDYAGERRRKAMRGRQAEREGRMQDRIAGLLEQGNIGSQEMYQARKRDIGLEHQDRSRAVLRDAGRRGLVHSGYGAARGRDLERSRQGSLTQARGAAQNHLLRALGLASGAESTLMGQGMKSDFGMEQLEMMSDKDFADFMEFFEGLMEAGKTIGGYAGGAGGAGATGAG